MKKILILFLAFIVVISGTVCAENQTIRAEIESFLKNDEDMKIRSTITDKQVLEYLGEIDRLKMIGGEQSALRYAVNYFFYKIFPCGLLAEMFKGLVFLDPGKTPQLHAMVTQLASRYNMPAPHVFIAGKKDFFNAFATSFSQNTAIVVVGKKLLEVLDDDALEVVLAHELSHIRNNHMIKKVGISLAGIIALLGFYSGGLYYINKKSNPQLSDELKATIAAVEPQWSFLTQLVATFSVAGCLIGGSYLFVQYLLKISREQEKEADFDALSITENKNSFIKAMQSFEEHYRGEIAMLQKSQKYAMKKIEELAITSPKVADSLKNEINVYVQGMIRTYQEAIEEESCIHPSLATRKAYATSLNEQ